jgi:3-methylfumaryl-CoA hydratase
MNATPATPDLQDWIGRTQTVSDAISAVPLRQMAALMNDAPRMRNPMQGGPLPAGWHWLYFNPLEVQAKLGADGHPERGDFLPPVQLPRRMWAGSRLHWQRDFEAGMQIDKASEIIKVSQKSGRSGEMVFVTVAHRYSDSGGLILEEEHDIVYREWASAAETEALRLLGEQVRAGSHAFERQGQTVLPWKADSVALFRYSAATFNGHRIHYDADYCRQVEGYPGLVVHGPLLATLLLHLVQTQVAPGRALASFEFRALKPTFDLSGFHLHCSAEGDGLAVWTTNNVGQVGVDGRVTLR